MSSVHEAGGFPARVRTDCGTENGMVATIQSVVTGTGSSHIYGTSPGNQRIEAWWSFFRRHRSQWWIEFVESLIEFGVFHPGCHKETDCLRYCFMDLIQSDLDEVRRQWNTHRIRPSVGARCPAGIPDELYHLPPPPATDCLIRPVRSLAPEISEQLENARDCEDVTFASYLDYLCGYYGWMKPDCIDDAVKLYFQPLSHI